MVLSRVVPTLIRLNCVINLNSLRKTYPPTVRLLCPEKLSFVGIRNMSTDIDKELNDPKRHFDYNQLLEKQKDKNVVVVDVREHSEIKETGKIPGSIHIPLAEVQKALGEMSPEDFKNQYNASKPEKDTEVIFSCKAGGRSLKALRMGLELGYAKAGNYKGGWLDWAEKSGQKSQ